MKEMKKLNEPIWTHPPFPMRTREEGALVQEEILEHVCPFQTWSPWKLGADTPLLQNSPRGSSWDLARRWVGFDEAPIHPRLMDRDRSLPPPELLPFTFQWVISKDGVLRVLGKQQQCQLVLPRKSILCQVLPRRALYVSVREKVDIFPCHTLCVMFADRSVDHRLKIGPFFNVRIARSTRTGYWKVTQTCFIFFSSSLVM